jgi:hypothetical protein
VGDRPPVDNSQALTQPQGCSQGGYGYCAAFLVFGALAWCGDTLWWARRRGCWPSAVSGWLFGRVLGERTVLPRTVLSVVVIVPRRRC